MTESQRLKEYDRLMLRSAFVSLFWAAITERRRAGKFTLQSIADYVGTNKSAVSRWFSNDAPNWTVDTISDVAGALDLELKIEAVDRITGKVFASSGPSEITSVDSTSTELPGNVKRVILSPSWAEAVSTSSTTAIKQLAS